MTTQRTQTPVYYTIKEAREILRYSEATMYRLLRRGEIPSKGTGKLRRIPRWAVEMHKPKEYDDG
jgi:excisionase family DNA binding protein